MEGAKYSMIEAKRAGLLANVYRIVIRYYDFPKRHVIKFPRRNVIELAIKLQANASTWERQEHSALPGQGLGWREWTVDGR